MASIGGLSGNTSSTLTSIRGYGGLVSGLDRDSLIEGMTAGTKAKINKQLQKKQTYQWQQEGYRGISNKLIEFSRKYTSYTNPQTNLSSANFFSRSNITALGANSKYIGVSGSSSIVDSLSLLGVKQMAKDTTMSSKNPISDPSMATGGINLFDGTDTGEAAKESISNLEGQSLVFKWGNKTVSAYLGSGTTSDGFTYDYSTKEKAVESINYAFKNVAIGDGKTLADIIGVNANDIVDTDGNVLQDENGVDKFNLNFVSKDTAGNNLQIIGGGSEALKALGVLKEGETMDKVSDSRKTITSSGFAPECISRQDFFRAETFAERVGGKNLSFTYNGTTKSIAFMSKEDIESLMENATGADDDAKARDVMGKIAADMQTKINKQFGNGRIKVDSEAVTASPGEYKLSFTTMDPKTGLKDNTSVLAMTGSDTGVLGKSGALHAEYGESNRLNLSSALADSGLNGIAGKLAGKVMDTTDFYGANKALDAIEKLGSKVTSTMSIEELKAEIKKDNPFMSDKDYSSICSAIDNQKGSATTAVDLKTELGTYVSDREMDLTINGTKIKGLSYNSTMNEIISTINSSDAGVKISYMKNADKFSIQATAGGAAGEIKLEGDAAGILFGAEGTDYTVDKGQDAIVSVKYAGSDEQIDLIRGSNTFDLDGLNISLKGEFGTYKADGKVDTSVAGSEAVTFDAKVDSEKITKAVEDMIKDLNEAIKLVNDEVTTKPNRDYEPLTDEQKEQLSEDQIEKWEKEAKKGILFGDSDLRGLADSMRFIFDTGTADKKLLDSIGISVSTNYEDNGKLTFDATKFKAALESNPEDVQDLFTRKTDAAAGDKGGLMACLTTITEKYASTTGARKGILIERAGSIYAPTSIKSNYLQKAIDSIDDNVERLQDKLETETDRYIKQFTNLETLIQQMNSQSSWLSGQTGG